MYKAHCSPGMFKCQLEGPSERHMQSGGEDVQNLVVGGILLGSFINKKFCPFLLKFWPKLACSSQNISFFEKVN